MAKNKLGIWMATSLVIGNMVGAGIFLLPAAMAIFGGISLIGWVFSAAGALLIASVFSRASRLLPGLDGGPYIFTHKGFGDFAGFLMAWGYWISVWCANAAIVVSLISALSTFFPVLATNPLVAILTGLVAIWLLVWVNTLGIRASGEVQLVTTILKLIPLAAVALAGLFFVDWKNFVPFNRSGQTAIQAIGSSAALTLFAFLGMECATIPAEHIENPEKTVPRATMLGTWITIVVYILGSMSVMGIIRAPELQRSVTPFADAAAAMWGDRAHYWMAAGVAMASFGALNGWLMVQGQIPYAVAKDRLFPEIFGRLNRKGVPAAGMIIGSVLVSVIMMMNFTKGLVEQFKFMILLSTLTSLVPYLMVSAAYVVILMHKQGTTAGKWTNELIVASLAFIFSLLAIIGAGEEIVFLGFVLMLAGIPLYVYIIWKRR